MKKKILIFLVILLIPLEVLALTDLFDSGAGVFTAGTYSWATYGTNTIANVGNRLEVTYDNDARGAYLYLRDSADLSADLVVGALYKFTFDAEFSDIVNDQRLLIGRPGTNVAIRPVDTSNNSYVSYFNCTGAPGTVYIFLSGLDAGDVIYLDNLTLARVEGNFWRFILN